MTSLHTLIRIALAAGLCGALAGCLSSTPHWDETFGDSVRQLRAMQTLNPQGSANTDPVAGIDGTAATAAQKSYAKSFTAPVPPVNGFTIGIGSSSSY
ncbi:hypothetical protein LFL96_31090 [Paraburkholderia sp. D15]|uniref:hypothetical protein n=1 Tax=Paraburkholderia sp. D15 TaxID=2880218 RepID=UPI00247A3C1C|nr:hypothetical protein [Paraburkholderia sp. D15]WGS52632.1 hypothetical protein LFL96_31090 [Paraburkholderia sp. D15]WKF61949.1 hypothetical protein HUO10_006481 [Paraburkholderia busanensis]